MAARFQTPTEQFKDGAGNIYALGKLYFYSSGTSSPLDTYADEALTTPNPNPVTLDSAGRAGNVFLLNQRLYKVVLTDADGDQIWTRDPVGSRIPQVTAAGGNMGGTINFDMGAPVESSNITPPPVPGITSRDWRVYITVSGGISGGSNYVLLSGIGFRSAIGGANIATGGTASASSTDASSAAISTIIGEANNTKWFSDRALALPQWIAYNWPAPVNIQEVTLGFPNTATASALSEFFHAPLTFALQYSPDGGLSWISYYSFDLSPSGWLPQNNVTGRFAVGSSPIWYRIRITDPPASGSAYQFAAAQIRATHGGANMSAGGFACSKTFNSYIATDGNFASGCFGQTDISPGYFGNGGAYGWLSQQNPTLPEYLSIGFYFPVATMTEMQLEVANNAVVGFFTNRYPSNFTIESSPDFSSWSTLFAATGAAWVSLVPQQFSW